MLYKICIRFCATKGSKYILVYRISVLFISSVICITFYQICLSSPLWVSVSIIEPNKDISRCAASGAAQHKCHRVTSCHPDMEPMFVNGENRKHNTYFHTTRIYHKDTKIIYDHLNKLSPPEIGNLVHFVFAELAMKVLVYSTWASFSISILLC